MKRWFRFLAVSLAVLFVLFVIAGIAASLYAPKFIEGQIERSLKIKTRIGRVSLGFPFTLNLEKFEFGSLANIKKISVSADPAPLFFGKIFIRRITVTEPVVNLERSAEGKINLPVFGQKEPAGQDKPGSPDNPGKPMDIYIAAVKVQNAKIIFTDREVTPEGYQVIVDKLDINVGKLAFPLVSTAVNFDSNCQVLNSSGSAFGKLLFSGWVDYPAGGMDAKLEVKDMDVVNFSPYYGNFISNKKLLSARLDLVSLFKAKNNALNIDTDFNLSNITYAQGQSREVSLDLVKNALDMFTDSEGKLHLAFEINTRMDKPDFNQAGIKEAILKAAMKNLVSQDPEQVVDKVGDVIDKIKTYGKGLKDIFGR